MTYESDFTGYVERFLANAKAASDVSYFLRVNAEAIAASPKAAEAALRRAAVIIGLFVPPGSDLAPHIGGRRGKRY